GSVQVRRARRGPAWRRRRPGAARRAPTPPRPMPSPPASELLKQVPEVVITLGEAGSLYAARGADPVQVPAVRVEAVDTTAAGDTFVGALCVAYGEGRPMPEAMAWAAAASALAVQRPGASSSMPARDEIDALVQNHSEESA
ncbi:hypothetical protein G5C51_23825, partial [Streptomyces sp. A7024]|nr:hypothetical protein [Streptomyces coryli]